MGGRRTGRLGRRRRVLGLRLGMYDRLCRHHRSIAQIRQPEHTVTCLPRAWHMCATALLSRTPFRVLLLLGFSSTTLWTPRRSALLHTAWPQLGNSGPPPDRRRFGSRRLAAIIFVSPSFACRGLPRNDSKTLICIYCQAFSACDVNPDGSPPHENRGL